MISAPMPGPQLLVHEPSHEAVAGVPERCLQALAGAGGEAVERDGKVVNANKRHGG
jgi:hypothetical protein